MNPQTGEVLAMVSLPDLRRQPLCPRDQHKPTTSSWSTNPDKPLLNHAIQAHYPPGSTYKLVAGTGGLADSKITATTKIATKGYLTIGATKFYDWNRRGFGPCDIYCGFGHSSDTYFFQVGRHARHRSARLLGQPVRVRRADRDRPARRGVRDRPDQPVEAGRLGADLPRRDLPGRASARATTS